MVSIFEQCPAAFMDSPRDVAEIAYGLMIGLRSAVYFDTDVGLDDAHRLFMVSLLRMGGLD